MSTETIKQVKSLLAKAETGQALDLLASNGHNCRDWHKRYDDEEQLCQKHINAGTQFPSGEGGAHLNRCSQIVQEILESL